MTLSSRLAVTPLAAARGGKPQHSESFGLGTTRAASQAVADAEGELDRDTRPLD